MVFSNIEKQPATAPHTATHATPQTQLTNRDQADLRAVFALYIVGAVDVSEMESIALA